jgi:hypothetical protein
MAITFQAERLIGRLNALEATQIKYAGTQAMKRLGFEMRSELGRYMQATFNSAVPFTVKSALYRTTGGLSVGIFINPTGDEKGQSPASYLFPLTPQSDGGAALTTRFTKGLRKLGVIDKSTWALNWLPDPETPQRNGTTEPGLLKALLSALSQSGGRLASKRSKYAVGGTRYFSVPDQRATGRQNTHLAKGIYRVKAGERPVRLMGYLDRQPKVPQKFDFEGVVRDRSAALLPGLLRAELDRALR